MRHTAAAFVAVIALAGCQTVSAPVVGGNAGHLVHSFTEVTRGTVTDEPGFTHIFRFTEVSARRVASAFA